MSEHKIVMFYRRAAKLRRADLAKLEAAGFICVACEDFGAVSFPSVASKMLGFVSPDDEMGVAILRAATESTGFDYKLGTLIVQQLKARAGITKKPASEAQR